jgi:hypothetical protein
MRIVKLFEKSSLFDAKFVLFIDDGQLNVVAMDSFLDKCMCSDDDVECPCFYLFFDLVFL